MSRVDDGRRVAKVMPGMRIGSLKVIATKGVSNKDLTWLCECDCGTTKTFRQGSLVRMLKNKRGSCVKCHTRHGTHRMSKTPTHNTWKGMRQRCLDPNSKNYHNYGGRGIRFCARWNIFENFLEDMGEKPEGMTLERIDTDGNYTPENCRWATPKEQQNNRRNNRRITLNGKTQTLRQWEDELNLTHGLIWSRLKKGWTEHDSIHGRPSSLPAARGGN